MTVREFLEKVATFDVNWGAFIKINGEDLTSDNLEIVSTREDGQPIVDIRVRS